MLVIDFVKLQDEVGGEFGPATAVLGIVKSLVVVEFFEAVKRVNTQKRHQKVKIGIMRAQRDPLDLCLVRNFFIKPVKNIVHYSRVMVSEDNIVIYH